MVSQVISITHKQGISLSDNMDIPPQLEVEFMEKNNQPEKKFRAGGITATIWKNASVDEHGQPRDYKTISFEKGYKDKTGSWKSTNSMSVTDLPKAIVVLSKAYEFLTLKGAPIEVETA